MREFAYFCRGSAIVLVLACAACDEKPSSDSAPTPSTVVTPELVASLASAAQSASSPPAPSAIASSLSSATPASSVRLAASASSGSVASAKAASSAVPIAPVVAQYVGDGYAIDYSAPGECVVGAPCPVVLHFTAIAPYHVNQEYSYKLTLDPSTSFSGGGHDQDSKSIYSKRGGDFHIDSEKTATMQVPIVGTAPGPVNVAGIFKLSACSDEKCLIDTKRISLGVQMRAN